MCSDDRVLWLNPPWSPAKSRCMQGLIGRWKRLKQEGRNPMHSRIRVVGRALLVAALISSVAGVARAGGEAGGDITFRLILRGDVIEGDSFTLAVNELVDPPTIISPGVRCGPGSEAYNPEFVPCEPGTYDFVVQGSASLPVGTELEYVWARNYGGEADPQAARIYTDTITVTENAQVFTVVYDYGGGAALPDTAMRAPAEVVPFGIIMFGWMVLSFATLVRVRNRRCDSPNSIGSPYPSRAWRLP